MKSPLYEFYDESQIPFILEFLKNLLPEYNIHSSNFGNGIRNLLFQEGIKIYRFTFYKDRFEDEAELIITDIGSVIISGSELYTNKITQKMVESFLIGNMRNQQINKII